MRSLLLSMVLAIAVIGSARGDHAPQMTVWKSPSCGCCQGWVDHMRANGFVADVEDTEALDLVKDTAGIPHELRSCHTARVGDYVIEGHVPADDVARLLGERPDAIGLAVPGMPSGSPGMENGFNDPYDVLLINRDGTTEVFESHR